MIKIELDKDIRTKLEKTHWKWFLCRLRKKCKWNLDKTYYQYLFENLILLDSVECGYSENDKTKLWNQRLRYLVVGYQDNSFSSASGEIVNFSFFEKLNGPRQYSVRQKKNESRIDYLKRLGALNRKKRIFDHFSEIFGYEDFSSASQNDSEWYSQNQEWYGVFLRRNKNKDWNNKILCEKLHIDVCPYCNRQYIYTYKKGNSNKNTAEIDHFRPKQKYPYLSCSLYNFIPACHTCNFVKHQKDENIVYPYMECFSDDGKFEIKRDDSQEMKIPIDVRNSTVKVTIVEKEDSLIKEKIKNSKKMFCLEEIYSKHQLDVGDLLLRYNRYGKMKMKEIAKVMKLPEAIVRKMVLGLPLQVDERKEYVLRKFKDDIIDQLEQKSKEISQ